jgi:hypothetical protein
MDHEIVVYIYTMGYYSAIRNDCMLFESKWMQLEDIMLSEVVAGRRIRRKQTRPES